MINLHIKLHLPGSNGSFVIVIKLKCKYVLYFARPSCSSFTVYKKISEQKLHFRRSITKKDSTFYRLQILELVSLPPQKFASPQN